MSQTTAYWLIWGCALLFVGIVLFAVKELKEFKLGEGGTLSEVTERAIRKSRLLWWSVLTALVVLSVGFALTGIHWYTSLF